jgi:prolipoprotein diacylglyceryltransferase
MNIYLIVYGILRFLIEFVRGDDRGSFIPGLTPSQFWAIIMIVMGILFMFIMPIIIKKYNIDFDYNPEEIQETEVVENN